MYFAELVWVSAPIWYPLIGIVLVLVAATAYAWVSGSLRHETHSWYLLPFYAIRDELQWHLPWSMPLKVAHIREQAEWHVSRGGGAIGGRMKHWDCHELLLGINCHDCARDYFTRPHRVWLIVCAMLLLWPIMLILWTSLYMIVEDPAHLL